MINILYTLIFSFFIYFNLNTSITQNNNSKISLKENLIIKSNDIGLINGIQIDSKGQIYISDGMSQCIHLYSSDGKFLRKIGRKGKGPGEYQYIWGIQITKGDTLVVYDGVQYRLTLYAPGKFDSPIKTITLPSLENKPNIPGTIGNSYSGYSGLWIPFNSSNIYLIVYNQNYSINNVTQKHYSELYKLDNKGKFIQENPLIKIEGAERLVITSGGKFMVLDMPIAKNPVIRINKDGIIYYATTDKFNITAVDLNGKKKNEINYKVDRIFITDKLWQSELNKTENLTLKDVKNSKTKVPEYLPVFDDFTIDDNNNLWVAVNQKDYKSYKYYIFNEQGKLLNTIAIPNKTVIKEIKKGFAYGIRTDNWGIQSIVRYKIVK